MPKRRKRRKRVADSQTVAGSADSPKSTPPASKAATDAPSVVADQPPGRLQLGLLIAAATAWLAWLAFLIYIALTH